MGAALLALGQALVDAIAVGVVGDDEDPGFGGGWSREDERAGQERWNGPHDAPENERSAGKSIISND